MIDLIRVPDPTCIDDLTDEPQGLLYLGAMLRKNGFDVRITNLAGKDYTNWKSEIKEANLYGIQLYTPTSAIGIEIAKFIKEKFPGKPVICGGAHPTALPEEKGLEVFDRVVVGEGEYAIVEIAKAYESGDTSKLTRIIRAPPIKDLDAIPFPAWDLVDIMAFHRKVNGQRSFGISGSRGCCYRCAFCDHSLFGDVVRFRSVKNVVDEIKQLIALYGVRNFEFFDDMWTVSKERLEEFNERVKDMGISYRCNGRADVLSKEIYDTLYESGCRVICFGIESGSQRILNLMRKGTTVDINLKAIKMAQDAGLTVIGYFILGFPGETKETIKETIDFINKSNIDQAQFYTFIPLPGTDVYRHPERYGVKILSNDFSQYYLVTGKDGHGGKVIETEYLSAEDLGEEMKKIREFLRQRGSRGSLQDYYTKSLGYKVGDN